MDSIFKARIVKLIFLKETEKALDLLSQQYEVKKPKIKVGMPKGYSKVPACYAFKRQTIYVSQSNILYNPRIILHEFYHHLRNVTNSQKGVEKYANKFAHEYLEAYSGKNIN